MSIPIIDNTPNFEEMLGQQLDIRMDAYEEGLAKGFEEGMREAFRMVLNEIPCKKNCQCCLRDGDTSCYVPDDDTWFVNDIVNMIRQHTKNRASEYKDWIIDDLIRRLKSDNTTIKPNGYTYHGYSDDELDEIARQIKLRK